MYVFLVQYDDLGKNTSVFSSFDKAKLDVIYYLQDELTRNFSGWDFEELLKEWDEYAKEQGYSDWVYGLLYCPYEKIDMYLGDFADIERVKVDEHGWRT